MEKNEYNDLLKELDYGQVSFIRNTKNGLELESNYFGVTNSIKPLFDSLDSELKNKINTLITYIALDDAKRTESSNKAFQKHFGDALDHCQSEKDFMALEKLFNHLYLLGGKAKEDAFLNYKLVTLIKKKWQRGLSTKPVKKQSSEIEEFLKKYHELGKLCEKVFNAPSIKEEEVEDTINQIDILNNEYYQLCDKFSEKERDEIEQNIQNMINTGFEVKEFIENEKNNWSL